jgi:hypothetical protein
MEEIRFTSLPYQEVDFLNHSTLLLAHILILAVMNHQDWEEHPRQV